MTELRRETSTAVAAVREALQLASSGAGEVHSKAGRDVVTDADLAIEDHLRRSLTRAFTWPVVGEERGGDVPGDTPYWLVDPICGTRNFASGIPLFSVNVAMVEDGHVAIAVVGDGSNGHVLVAQAGDGAWRAGERGLRPLSTSDSSLVVDVGAWPAPGARREAAARRVAEAIDSDRWDVRCLSTTLALAYVATGQIAACVLFAATATVHSAAGALLVGEAGGRVTDAAGRPWRLGATSLVCAANERLHEAVLHAFGDGDSPAAD